MFALYLHQRLCVHLKNFLIKCSSRNAIVRLLQKLLFSSSTLFLIIPSLSHSQMQEENHGISIFREKETTFLKPILCKHSNSSLAGSFLEISEISFSRKLSVKVPHDKIILYALPLIPRNDCCMQRELFKTF